MNKHDAHVLNRVLMYSIAGSFSGMVLVGAVLWFDISSIRGMFMSGDNTMLANLFLSGAMLKGAVVGAAVGVATLTTRPERALARRSAGTRAEAGR